MTKHFPAMRRAAAALVLLSLSALPARGSTALPVRVEVDASAPTGTINRNLGGVDWMGGTADAVNELHPNLARADIAFQDAAKPDGTYNWSFADGWVAEAKAAGAEPMLILNYMPAWLAATQPGDPRSPAHLPPRDFGLWEKIVYDGVLHFAARGVRWFEVWNEPDWVGFWEDTPAAFIETARHTALAVQRVRAEWPELDIRFGGPACLFPDPECVTPWLAMMRAINVRPDFVSWHYYGNYPFVGPDGREPTMPAEAYAALGHTNPAGGVALFPAGVEVVRATTAAALAGTGWPTPELILDEWNVSAGGLDLRNDTNEGAAFDAGVLAEFQRAGLSRAAFFISKDAYIGNPEVNPEGKEFMGDWGLVSWKGTRKPAWWTFWLWQQMASDEVAVTGSSAADGFWAVASRDGSRLTVMLSSFLTTGAHAHEVTLDIDGFAAGPVAGEIRRLDPDHVSAANWESVSAPSPVLTLTLPPNSVLFVDIHPA